MPRIQKRLRIISFGLPAVIGISALAFASVRAWHAPRAATTTAPSVSQAVKKVDHVRRSLLRPKLGWYLTELGDRLERPGRERVSLVGTIRWADDRGANPILILGEFPDRMRLTFPNVGNRVIVFDGDQIRSASSISTNEKSLLESVVYDSAEHFFAEQMKRHATRFLGSGLRMDDGLSENYGGPYYDVYQVADEISTNGTSQLQTKFFYFNSQTFLLERVKYQMQRNGEAINIETVLSDWRKENGQQIPRRIERFENGASVFALTFTSHGFSARANDGTFDTQSN